MMSNSDFEMAKSLEDLKEDMEALRLRMAFQAEWEDELAALEKSASETDSELDALIAESDSRIRRRISRETRKISTIAFARKTLPAALRVAAILVLVFYLGLTTAVATSHSVRIGIIELISKIEDEYTTLDLQKLGEDTQIPPEWKGACFPSKLPHGYALSKCVFYNATFTNGLGGKIVFAEYDDISVVQIDTSRDESKYVDINGTYAALTDDGIQTSLSWIYEQHLYVMFGNVSSTLLIETARSIVPCQ